MCGFFATAGLSYSFNKRSSRVGRRARREINQGGKLFLRSMGQIARERAEFPVIFLRQERIRMAGGRGGTATRQRALQLQRRETQNQQAELTGGTSEQVYLLIVLVGNLARPAAN